MKVLIVDDQDGIAFRDTLFAWGKLDPTFDRVRVETSFEGVRAALDVAWPDLIVLDAYFPERDGQHPQFMAGRVMALIAERSAARDPKVILVSGQPDIREHWSAIVEWFDRSELHDVLPKTELSELTFLLLAKRVEMLRKLLDVDLSPRREDVLGLLAAGCTNKEIARRLDLAPATVKVHLKQIFEILGVSNRLAAALAARNLGLRRPRQRTLRRVTGVTSKG